jgi:hypothetical protein
MHFISAIFKHAWLIINLKHNGSGLPKSVPAALALASVYTFLTTANLSPEAMNQSSLFGILFVAYFYVYVVRNALIGLILMISIISNSLTLFLAFIGLPHAITLLVTLFEYVMVFFALINVIKANFKIS